MILAVLSSGAQGWSKQYLSVTPSPHTGDDLEEGTVLGTGQCPCHCSHRDLINVLPHLICLGSALLQRHAQCYASIILT